MVHLDPVPKNQDLELAIYVDKKMFSYNETNNIGKLVDTSHQNYNFLSHKINCR